MECPPDSPERPPALRRRTVLGYQPIDIILLVLALGATAGGVSLLFRSTDPTVGATLLVGVLVAVGTYRTMQVTREGQITQRLTKAVTQLDAKNSRGKRNEVIVLGGIYALERIAANSRVDYQNIMEILTSFVRTCVPLPKGGVSEKQRKESVLELPDDIQAALAVLARRTPLRRELRLNLRATELPRAKLPYAHLQNALLDGADLRLADLRGANLQGADLRGACLQGAKPRRANLWLTLLQRAKPHPSNADEAKFKETKLERAEDDTDTKWPRGFDPEAWGVVRIERHSKQRGNDWLDGTGQPKSSS